MLRKIVSAICAGFVTVAIGFPADAAASATFQQRLDDLGVRTKATSPSEMRDFVAGEIARWNGVIDRAGLPRIE